MVKSSFCFVFLILGLCSASVGFAGNNSLAAQFSLRVEIPAGAGSCADHAQQLGASLSQTAKVQVAQTQCKNQNTISDSSGTFTTDTIILTYISDRQLETEKTFYSASSFVDTPNDFRGLFATYGECHSNIASQVQAFSTATGLPAFVAYCHRSSQFGDAGYILTIENLGRARSRLYVYNQDLIFEDNSPEVAPAVTKAVRGKNGTIVLSTPEHIFYYSVDPIWITSAELGYFNTLTDCTSQVSAAATIYSVSHATNITAFCAPFLDRQHARLKVIATDAEKVHKFISPGSVHYRGLADCLDDVPRVTANFKSRGAAVAGGICVPVFGSPTDYDLDIYVPRI